MFKFGNKESEINNNESKINILSVSKLFVPEQDAKVGKRSLYVYAFWEKD